MLDQLSNLSTETLISIAVVVIFLVVVVFYSDYAISSIESFTGYRFSSDETIDSIDKKINFINSELH